MSDVQLDPAAIPIEVEEFLTWLAVERGRATNTLDAYRRDLRRYCAWLAERGVGLGAVGERDIVDFVADLRSSGMAPASVERATVAVRSLHRFLSEEGM